jgi:formyl-CoA transferase/CoA:oxalate CoA-transferase
VFWSRLCTALERPELIDDARFATNAARVERRAEVDALIAEAMRGRTVADWVERLTRHDVPNAPVLGVGAALEHPQSRAREMVVEAQHPRLGPIRMVGRPVKFPGSPQAPLAPPPMLGEHTVQVLRERLGLDESTLEALRRDGVIDRTGAA